MNNCESENVGSGREAGFFNTFLSDRFREEYCKATGPSLSGWVNVLHTQIRDERQFEYATANIEDHRIPIQGFTTDFMSPDFSKKYIEKGCRVLGKF